MESDGAGLELSSLLGAVCKGSGWWRGLLFRGVEDGEAAVILLFDDSRDDVRIVFADKVLLGVLAEASFGVNGRFPTDFCAALLRDGMGCRWYFSFGGMAATGFRDALSF